MQRIRLVVAVALVVAGSVWVGQGLGYIRGSSFMVDDPFWAAAGVVAIAVGGFLAWDTLRAR